MSARTARCRCGTLKPSADLVGDVFFVSAVADAKDRCVCGYYDTAHGKPPVAHTPRLADGHAFQQRPVAEFDSFYCGCRGWE